MDDKPINTEIGRESFRHHINVPESVKKLRELSVEQRNTLDMLKLIVDIKHRVLYGDDVEKSNDNKYNKEVQLEKVLTDLQISPVDDGLSGNNQRGIF